MTNLDKTRLDNSLILNFSSASSLARIEEQASEIFTSINAAIESSSRLTVRRISLLDSVNFLIESQLSDTCCRNLEIISPKLLSLELDMIHRNVCCNTPSGNREELPSKITRSQTDD